MKLVAFIAASSMLLGSYFLNGLRRQLLGLLGDWQRDPVERWSAVVPSSPK